MEANRISSPAAYAASPPSGATTGAGKVSAKGEVNLEPAMMDPVVKFEAPPRTLEVVMAEVRYGIVFGEMNEVFNSRVHRVLNFLALAAVALSGAALLGLLKEVLQPSTVTWWAVGCIAVAALAKAADVAFRFKERANEFRAAKSGFQVLEGTGWSSNLNTVQKELAKLRSNAPAGGSWIAPLAYNKACKELGHPDVQMPIPGSTQIGRAHV